MERECMRPAARVLLVEILGIGVLLPRASPRACQMYSKLVKCLIVAASLSPWQQYFRCHIIEVISCSLLCQGASTEGYQDVGPLANTCLRVQHCSSLESKARLPRDSRSLQQPMPVMLGWTNRGRKQSVKV